MTQALHLSDEFSIPAKRSVFIVITQRFSMVLFSMWGAVTLVFFFTLATGNPILLMTGGAASLDDIARVSQLHGFDQPLWQQYLRFVFDIFTGQFPASLRFETSPFDSVLPALKMTALLAGAASVISLTFGLLLGYVSVRAKSAVLRGAIFWALTLAQSVPVFISGLLLVLVFSVQLGWLPTAGASSARHLILPSLTLAFLLVPQIARVFRSSLQQNSQSDHVRAALTRNVSLAHIELRHVIANSLVPVVGLMGVQLGSIFGGTVLTETVFGWPGLGSTLVSAVSYKDYPVIIASIMVISLIISLFAILADVIGALLDPRSRSTER